MKTVLFVDESLKNAIVGYQGFIDDITGKYDVSVCPWYEDGSTPEDIVPDLENIVADDTSWRAIILVDLSEYGPQGAYIENPFDFLGNGVAGPTPVLTLAQILGGVPKQFVGELVVQKDIEDAYDFQAQGMQGPLPVVSNPRVWAKPGTGDVDDLALARLLGEVESSLRSKIDVAASVPVLQGRLSEEETGYLFDDAEGDLRATFEIVMPYKRYHTRWGRPAELFVVSPRNIPQDYSHFAVNRPDSADGYHLEQAPSRFWMRNSFPSQTCYVVLDRPEPPTVADDYYLLLLLSAVLQIAVIDFAPGEVEAYKLYEMRLDIDKDRLGGLIAKKHDLYQGALDVVPRELRRIYVGNKPVNRPIQNLSELHETIECVFSVDSSDADLRADPDRFGLTKQRPSDAALDEREWKLQYDRMLAAFLQVAKSPRRALRNAVEQFNVDSEQDEVADIRLNSDQVEDLTEELRETEFKLAGTTIADPFDENAFKSAVEEQNEDIRGFMAHRPFDIQAILLVVMAIVAYLLGSVPFVFGLAGGNGFDPLALAASLGVAAFLAIACLFGLLFYRRKLRRKVSKTNDEVNRSLSDMRESARVYAHRLSDYATFRSSYPVLEAQHGEGMRRVDTERVEAIKRANSAFVRGFEENEKLMCVLNYPIDEIPRATPYLNWAEVEEDLRNGVFESVFTEDTRGSSMLNGKFSYGRRVEAPYDYIVDVTLCPVRLLDPDGSIGGPVQADSGWEAE